MRGMNRRAFVRNLGAVVLGSAANAPKILASVPKMKITRIRAYAPPHPNPLFNQSDLVVTVETDAGVTGIGEGGSRDTLQQCAGRLIGRDPHFIERLWQDMSRAFFYPPGREKLHAIGALDLALWDIKGKVLGLPVHSILGGLVRDFCECYNTGASLPGTSPEMSVKEQARAAIEAGYRAFRIGAANAPPNTIYDTRERMNQIREECAQAREGVDRNGEWMIDFHQRFDLADAIRGCDLIQEYEPLFVEDPVRAEAFQEDLPKLRRLVKVPLAAGEEWGNRWDFNRLVEQHDLDYVRATLPNVGGITEMMKIAAICETHFVGIVPHFTGPIATAALVNCLSTFSGPLLVEYNRDQLKLPYIQNGVDFRKGKLYPTGRPGLGVELDMKGLKLVCEVTQPVSDGARTYFRTDGSITNW